MSSSRLHRPPVRDTTPNVSVGQSSKMKQGRRAERERGVQSKVPHTTFTWANKNKFTLSTQRQAAINAARKIRGSRRGQGKTTNLGISHSRNVRVGTRDVDTSLKQKLSGR